MMKSLLTAACVAAVALAATTSANSAVVTWDLASPPNTNLGLTHTFLSTPSAFPLPAAGFSFPSATNNPVGATFTPISIYAKDLGGDERGLGITGATDNEIVANTLVRLDTTAVQAAGATNFRFSMDSSTFGEGWSVYGSTAANTGLSLVTTGTDELDHFLTNAFKFYYFLFNGEVGPVQPNQANNVLVGTFAASNCPFTVECGPFPAPGDTPVPAALPLFVTGLGALGLLGWRRKRKAAAAV